MFQTYLGLAEVPPRPDQCWSRGQDREEGGHTTNLADPFSDTGYMQYTEIVFLQNWLLVKAFNVALLFCNVKTGNDVHTRVILFAQSIGAF